MKSIPAAMTWELVDRGRWSLPAAALGCLAFPLLVLSSLAQEGALKADDKSILIMHFVLVQMNAIAFGAPLIVGAWQLRTLYVYPASAATLVAWRLLPAMVALFVETVAWTAAVNALFHLGWPLWGPALLSAVALAVVEAVVWLTEKSRWIILALIVVGAVLGFWFKSRYGAMFGEPTHQWTTVTPSEIFALLAFTGLAYWIAVVAATRNRRGEPPFSIGVAAWFDRLFDRAPSTRLPFRSPQRAQFWYVWRNGWIAPAVVAGVLLVGFVIWFFTSRDLQGLVAGLFVGSVVVVLAGFVGAAVMGNVSQTNELMIQFQATRPLTTSDHARTILRAAAASLLLAWSVWAVAMMAAIAGCLAIGLDISSFDDEPINWTMTPVFLLGSWIVMGTFLSICLTGRSRLLMRVLVGFMAVCIGGIVLEKFALSHEFVEQAMQAVAVLLGVAFVVGTIWAFIAARRRELVDATTTWAAFAAWAALLIAAVLMLPRIDGPRSAPYALLIGILSLAVAPLAAAPLALAWNRHR